MAMLCASFVALQPAAPAAGVTFTDVTASAGITHVQTTGSVQGAKFYAGGAAAGDFDGDGRVDLVFTRLGDAPILYHNQGDGTFAAQTAAAGFTQSTKSNGVVSGDVDNDGDLDLYMTGVETTRNYFYYNDGAGHFATAGAAEVASLDNGVNRYGMGASLGDYDDDGYLDVATGDWGNPLDFTQSRLLHNRGSAQPGHFDDVTVASGVNVYRDDDFTFRYSPRFVDLDRDGRMDLTFAADFKSSQIFWNDGDGTFTDLTTSIGAGTDRNGMGTTFADYDGDGDLDWFITNINDNPQAPVYGGNNRLYRNNGNRSFTDVTFAAGVEDSGWSWGTSSFDYDNDGDPDLAATNGFNGPGWADDRTVLWRNDGGVFTDVSLATGVTDTQQGRGLIHLDYDADGDLDMLVVNNGNSTPVLYRNDGGNSNHFVRIETEGTLSNRDGIGAWITVTPDLGDPTRRMVWEIDGGSSFLSQNERTAHFGLGASADPVDMITIEWPSGVLQRLFDVTADQTLHLVEPTTWYAADFDGDGDVDGDDLAKWQIACGQTGAADANLDLASDGFDVLAWQREFGAGAATANAASIPEPAAGLLAALGLAMLVKRSAVR